MNILRLFRPQFDLIESIGIAFILTVGTYGIADLAGWTWIDNVNWLEIVAVATSYSCTWLCVGQRRINYPIGAVSSAAYAVLFWQSGLIASAGLNAYLLGQLVYGYLRWRPDTRTRPVGTVQGKWWPVYALATAGTFAGAYGVATLFAGTMKWTDSAVLAATILAQFLLDNKKIETWAVWVVVNVFAIYTYASQGLWLAAFQFFFFLLNTVLGFYEWRKDYRAQSIHADDSHAADHGSSAADPVH